ncbi:MAG: RNase adapter RapZ [Bdellovibrionales bacterium]
MPSENSGQPPTSSASHSPSRKSVVLVTGLSGAGLSTALKMFEDLGYEAVDNLRFSLVPALLKDSADSAKPLAIAVDARNPKFNAEALLRMASELGDMVHLRVKLLFLDCSDDVLQQRFTATRRKHPLAIDRPMMDGIRREREMFWRVRDKAHETIDTSLLSVHDLRREIATRFRVESTAGLTLTIASFSFRCGLPREADMVFDARFLQNPYWEQGLRSLTGKDPAVAEYVANDPAFNAYMAHLLGLLLPLLPRFQQEGKSYLTIAVGCTGGRHRSVAVAEQLAQSLSEEGFAANVIHRDIDREHLPQT